MCFSLFIVVLRSLNTIKESIVSYWCHTVGDCHRCQADTARESTVSNALYTFSQNNCLNIYIVVKPVANNLAIQRQGGDIGTAIKSIVSYARHTVGDIYWGQSAAILKSRRSYACHAVGDFYWGGQSAAILKSRRSYACHAVGDFYWGQADAAQVFVNCFISINCNLNGRKVMS